MRINTERTTHGWPALSLRLTTFLTSAGTGFSFVLLQAVVTAHYWPGIDAAVAFAAAFAFGVLLGMALPDLSLVRSPILRSRQFDLSEAAKAQIALIAAVLIALIAVAVAVAITQLVIKAAPLWSERLLLTPRSWRLIALTVPGLPAWPMGVSAGLLLQLMYRAFIQLHCPQPLLSAQRELQHVMIATVTWLLAGAAAGAAVAQLAAHARLDRWPVLMLVPVIMHLFALAAALAKHPVRPAVAAEPPPDTLPEQAQPSSRSATLVATTLAWVAAWALAHWHFTWTNWYVAPTHRPVPSVFVLVVMPIALVAGLRIGRHAIGRGKPPWLTAIDQQALALAGLGLLNLAALPTAAWALGPGVNHPAIAQMIVALAAGVLVAAWAACLAMALPALAIGRPDRFELWYVLGVAMALGVLLALLCLLAWQRLGAGNLIGLALLTIVAIAVAAVALIYRQPHPASPQRARGSAVIFHAVSFVFLYAILGAVVVIVPDLKVVWLTGRQRTPLVLNEGPHGCAFLARLPSGTRELGTPAMTFPERTDRRARDDLTRLVVVLTRGEDISAKRALPLLLIGLPHLRLRDLPQSVQVDFHPAVRRLEALTLGREPIPAVGPSALRGHHSPFGMVVILMPDCRSPAARSFTGKLIDRARQLAAGESGVYVIGRGPPRPDLFNYLSRIHLRSSRREWTVYGTGAAIMRVNEALDRQAGSAFHVVGAWR